MTVFDRMRLDGRVALVTGGGRGIGAAVAGTLAEAGARVVVSARTREQLEQTVDSIRHKGGEAFAVVADVMQEAQLEHLVKATLDSFGRLDVLVNNAGGTFFPPKFVAQTSTEEFNRTFMFNVSSAFALTRIAIPRMIDSAGGGVVLNISSVTGRAPSSCFAAYGTAKAALSFLTRELAQEFAPRVRVNAIACGSIRTHALQRLLTAEIEETMVALTPMNRLGTVEDIAACALYLASPAASYVTGEIVGVTGGLTTLNMKMPGAFD